MRDWGVTLTVTCGLCGRGDTATVGTRSAEDSRQGVMKVLRYRGWEVGGRSPRREGESAERCPEHAKPLRPCDTCADPTPEQYGHEPHWGQGGFLCPNCLRVQREQWWRDYRAGNLAASSSPASSGTSAEGAE